MEPEVDITEGVGTAEGWLHRGVTADGAVRFLAVEARALADRVRQHHDLGPDAARLAGEALISALLMSAWIKGEERVTLQVQGEAPRLAFICDVDATGGARARLTPSHLRSPDGRVQGLVYAIKSTPRAEIYRGVTALTDQTMEEGLLSHLTGSDQVDAILRLDAQVDADGSLTLAGGIMLERLPWSDAQASLDDEAFTLMFQGIRTQSVDDLLTALAFGSIEGQPATLLESRALHWRCSCSQQRIEAVLAQLDGQELRDMAQVDGKAEVTCNFCNIAWTVGAPRLLELAAARPA
jgi:molecular chaperone Hsp33